MAINPMLAAIQFISFIIGLSLIPYILGWLSPFIANADLLWIAVRAVAFFIIFHIFPRMFIWGYLKLKGYK